MSQAIMHMIGGFALLEGLLAVLFAAGVILHIEFNIEPPR
jgi:hypothetical protein